MLISPIQISSINSRTQNNKFKNNYQDNRQLIDKPSYANYPKHSQVSFGMDPVTAAFLIPLIVGLIELGVSMAIVGALFGSVYAISNISEWVDNLRNLKNQLLKKQIKQDQENIYNENNYQLTQKEVKKVYNKELERVSIKSSGHGDELGLNSVVGNNLLKLGLARNVLTPLLKVMDGDEASRENIPNGICFFGPKGAGKTYIANALGEHYQTKGGYYRELIFTDNDEKDIENMKQIFAEAEQKFTKSGGKRYTIVFLDEIDKNAQNSNIENSHPLRTSRLLSLVNNCKDKGVVLVTTANDLSKATPDLLRNGRTDMRVPTGPIEVFDVADMINYYIQKAGLTSYSIDYNKITDGIKTKKLVYKPNMIELMIKNIAKNSENHSVDTERLQAAIANADLEFSLEEKNNLDTQKSTAKQLGGLNENARYAGENIHKLNEYR